MTIGLLDPALLMQRNPAEVDKQLGKVLLACKHHNIRLLPFTEYWPDLWKELGRPLEAALPPLQRRAVQALRNAGQSHLGQVARMRQQLIGAVWKDGFEQLFGSINGTSWTERMAHATLRAVETGEHVVMFARLLEGRNLNRHAVGGCTLDEVTRWVLHVQSPVHGRRQVLCVHDTRNITERWTSRFDVRLPPATNDVGYPFCVPDKWWQAAIPAWRTVRSKPCWVDSLDNGWARPNVQEGRGNHWDVFIQRQALIEKIGLDQLNIVEYGSPEGRVGWIHHVPTEKQGRVDIDRRGWTCD